MALQFEKFKTEWLQLVASGEGLVLYQNVAEKQKGSWAHVKGQNVRGNLTVQQLTFMGTNPFPRELTQSEGKDINPFR